MAIRAGVIGFGPVGKNICRCVEELGLQCDELRVMATRERDEELDGKTVHVHQLGTEFSAEGLRLFEGLDVVFFAGREGEKGAALTWATEAVSAHGCFCIDNGGDLRLEEGVPLIVPEVNMDAATADTKFIASPNCSTIQMCVALAPLHRAARVRRVLTTTFQSVSGYGRAAQEELRKQLSECDPDDLTIELPFDPSVFRRPIVLDCLPHIDAFLDNGYTKEEMKMQYETQKIFGDPQMKVVATTVRVPVDIGHAESINAEFDGDMNAEMALRLWREAQDEMGIAVIDDLAKDTPGWPTPSAPKDDEYAGHAYAHERSYPTQRDILKDEYRNLTLVGRARDDHSRANAVNFWCVADNLRKGAATNVVQIAQGLVERGLLG